MFNKDTAIIDFTIDEQVFSVGRMDAVGWRKCSKLLTQHNVIRHLQKDCEWDAFMALMNLEDKDLDFIAECALKKAKVKDTNDNVMLSTFTGELDNYWLLVSKVLIANFTKLATQVRHAIAKQEVQDEMAEVGLEVRKEAYRAKIKEQIG